MAAMSQREIDLRKMQQLKTARLNSVPRMKEDLGRTVERPPAIAAVKRPAKKKPIAKSSRKRG